MCVYGLGFGVGFRVEITHITTLKPDWSSILFGDAMVGTQCRVRLYPPLEV